jgi:hypothetical protein
MTVAIGSTRLSVLGMSCRLSLIRQSEARQRHSCQADTEFLESLSARDGLRQSLGQFIEFIHNLVV